MYRLLILTLLLSASCLQGDKIALTAIFRNEERFLKEWVEYHRLIGVDYFYLTNHLSRDGYLKVLQPYIDEGILELRHETADCGHGIRWNRIQKEAYQWALQRAKVRGDEWLVVIDTDEFLVPKGEPLLDILQDFTPYGGVGVNWQLFGTSHVGEIPSGKLLIETLLLKGKKNLPENQYVKLIVQPKAVRGFHGPHTCSFFAPYGAVTTAKKPLSGKQSPFVCLERLQLNHYWSRDEAFFYGEKMKRKERMGRWFTTMEKRLEELDQETDAAILPFITPLRKKLGFLEETFK